MSRMSSQRKISPIFATSILLYDTMKVKNEQEERENMQEFDIEGLELRNQQEAADALRSIGCTEAGVRIMQEKAVFRVLRLRHVPTKAANLLKQAFLAKGADAAVSRNSADLSEEYTDVLVFATLRRYRAAAAELKLQPWGLAGIAVEIEGFLNQVQIK